MYHYNARDREHVNKLSSDLDPHTPSNNNSDYGDWTFEYVTHQTKYLTKSSGKTTEFSLRRHKQLLECSANQICATNSLNKPASILSNVKEKRSAQRP